MTERFTGSFTQQEPIPDAGIEAAMAVLKHGRLHRYNVAQGEVSETSLLEQEFAAFTGAKYCLATGSGGIAMTTAMRAAGVVPGDRVLTNAFTLAPVPGAIVAIGAEPVLVEITDQLVIDLEDLAAKAKATKARWLLLSHMRGHIAEMGKLMTLCDGLGIRVIEDCAHTMGAAWNGVPSGRHGIAGCYSVQTYKHMNAGEGGFIVTDDEDLAARAVLTSGSYMLYERHLAAPAPEVFERHRDVTPNISGRMDNLRAAILRPQLQALNAQCARWTERYKTVETGLKDTPGLTLVERPAQEDFVGSSIQVLLKDWSAKAITDVLARCLARGVELKWFGAARAVAFTSSHHNWRYLPEASLPKTDRILAGLIDMRLPLTFSLEDCALIARIIRAEVSAVWQVGVR
jgi:dTDP-4-amino-4,6-dideoxygalactose transaminase